MHCDYFSGQSSDKTYLDHLIMICVVITHDINIISSEISAITICRKISSGQKILPCPALQGSQGRALKKNFALPCDGL
jgi:hypothetical protein